ncbi:MULTISPECIES: tetratricopeptide repeat protein [unclassified Microcoleus]|uniref:tetratricopeptide repeat protein n=1 Tax=unclassified Microcoleus TaxID=2642155 RepID=UPI0025F469B9|nr:MULTISPECIES: tetratricopeptide repeat protein [unclassified Microcoleus]
MKQILSIILVLGACLSPLTVPVMVQPSWAQSQDAQSEELLKLIEEADRLQKQEKHQQAIEIWQQILASAQKLKNRELEGIALNAIGLNYYVISRLEEALKYFNQALPIAREVGDRSEEADILDSIGSVYQTMGQPPEALKYYNQALAIARQIGDRALESSILENIKEVNKTSK